MSPLRDSSPEGLSDPQLPVTQPGREEGEQPAASSPPPAPTPAETALTEILSRGHWLPTEVRPRRGDRYRVPVLVRASDLAEASAVLGAALGFAPDEVTAGRQPPAAAAAAATEPPASAAPGLPEPAEEPQPEPPPPSAQGPERTIRLPELRDAAGVSRLRLDREFQSPKGRAFIRARIAKGIPLDVAKAEVLAAIVGPERFAKAVTALGERR